MESNHNSIFHKILVCDDIYDNCFLFKILLEIEGYQVDTVTNGAAALAKIQSKIPDLLILDIMMPEMDGYEVVRCIRQDMNLQYFPIIFVTGSNQEYINKEYETIVDSIIQKPCAPEVLLFQVQRALQIRNL